MSKLFFASLFVTLTFCFGDEGLYKTADDVVILNNENFEPVVLLKDSAWLIEFYNSWCGHCVNFAPKWREFATDLKGWQKVVSIGAVDCSQKHNADLCRTYNIPSFPSLMFFPPNADKEYRGEITHDQDPDSLRQKVLDYLSTFIGDHKPSSWPVLQPLGSIEQIWDQASDVHKHVILLFENDNSYIGRQVILDLNQYSHLLIRRVTEANSAKFGIKKLPSLYVIHGDGRFEPIANLLFIVDRGTKERKDIVEAIKLAMKLDTNKRNNTVDTSLPQNTVQAKKNSITNGTVVYLKDLESALSYSLRQEVAIRKTIDGEALQALKKYIAVLTKYFPAEAYLRKFLLRVQTWLEGIASDLTGESWVYYIDSFQTADTYLPDNITWVGCKGSEPRYRGYPCSMWTLFHTLTVNSYVVGKDSPKFLYGEVLNAITAYMKHFFGCTVCSKHFLKMADSRQIYSASDSVIWLWDAHNKANKRLHGDQSEDPLHPKSLFPSAQACPKCITGNDEKGDNPKWNKAEVLNFLVKMYRKENIVKNFTTDLTQMDDKKSQSELDWWQKMQRQQDLQKIKDIRKMKKQKLEDKLKRSGQKPPLLSDSHNSHYLAKPKQTFQSGITPLDMNMCVLFYAMCLVIICSLYYHFVRKKKMNPCPSTNPLL